MPAAISQVVIKDGNAADIVGGVQALDLSGLGTGPWAWGHVLLQSDGATLVPYGSGVKAGSLRTNLATDDVLVTNVGAAADATSVTGTLSAKLRYIGENGGAIADAASATGSLSAKLRQMAETVFADNATFTAGSSKAHVIAGVYQASPGANADNQIAPLLTDANGQIKIAAGSAENTTLGAVRTYTVGAQYETVAASQTNQAMGGTGGTGDYLSHVICIVTTAATSQVQIKDGAGTAFTILPNAVGAGIGTYIIPVGAISTAGAWQVTTAAGVAAVGVGKFAA